MRISDVLAALVLGLAATGGPVPVEAQATQPDAAPDLPPMSRMLDAGAPCPLALPDWATPSERFAWSRICSGQPADMRLALGADDGKGCKATDKVEAWPEERRLTARFIKLVTTRRP